MIGKIQTAGRIGQFRTPRHIIQMMVRMMKPMLKDIIIDKRIAYLIQANGNKKTSQSLDIWACEDFCDLSIAV